MDQEVVTPSSWSSLDGSAFEIETTRGSAPNVAGESDARRDPCGRASAMVRDGGVPS